MKPKLTDLEKQKYWIDSEFTILHIMFAVLMLELTEGIIWTVILLAYIVYSFLYLIARLAVIAADDPNYLKVRR